MSVRLSASAVVLVSLLSSVSIPAAAQEPAAARPWSGYIVPVVVGGAIGALAMPYAYPVVAPTVGGALTATGGAIHAAVPAVGAAALDTAAAAGSYAAGTTASASSWLMAQTVQTQMVVGAALGALASLFMAN